ncbi:HU family DNA-binding protein [Gracilimonas mengyeensis]|uniref:Nucleoid DNA-binding protein n=1 Tax=Gracilimonas mengyeensis TaxID=1302730 RepID=A0A521DEA9_9BACT|nr:HU family DNA-binding protein [Gracilimonas mengyeensis]SMO69922.1 nucleoid DNA-binding protein [Gracilimonas mengyeensis]
MSNKVTYTEIVEALSRKTGFSKSKSEEFIKGVIGLAKQDLDENGKAVITNFGSFTVKEVAERQGQNPQTGEPITIPAHKRVNFSAYKPLRERVNAPFAHLETELLEEESGTDEQESEVTPPPKEAEAKKEPVSPSSRKKDNDNSGLMIAALLLLVIVALASGWFLMTADEETPATDQAAIETPQTPEATETMDDVAMEENSEETNTEQVGQADSPQATEPQSDSLPENPETTEQRATGSVDTPETYQVESGEWYWVIAEKVYGESGFWPLLFQANETLEDDPDQLYPSMGLEVPELEGTVATPTSNDYQRLALASTMVSEAYQRAGKTEKAEEYARFAEKWERQSRQ